MVVLGTSQLQSRHLYCWNSELKFHGCPCCRRSRIGLCNDTLSVRMSACLSVRCCSSVRRICCCGPGVQAISNDDSCGCRAPQQQMRGAVSRCQPTYEAEHGDVLCCRVVSRRVSRRRRRHATQLVPGASVCLSVCLSVSLFVLTSQQAQ